MKFSKNHYLWNFLWKETSCSRCNIFNFLFALCTCMCVCFKSGVVCDGLAELLGSNAAAALLLGRQRSFLIRGGKIPEGLSTLLTSTQPKVAEPAPKPSSYVPGLVAFLFLPHHRSSRTVVIRHRWGKKSGCCTEHEGQSRWYFEHGSVIPLIYKVLADLHPPAELCTAPSLHYRMINANVWPPFLWLWGIFS